MNPEWLPSRNSPRALQRQNLPRRGNGCRVVEPTNGAGNSESSDDTEGLDFCPGSVSDLLAVEGAASATSPPTGTAENVKEVIPRPQLVNTGAQNSKVGAASCENIMSLKVNSKLN